MKIQIAAAAILALAACAGTPKIAEQRSEIGPIECARLTQPEVPGGHGGYGGLYDEEHPYYLPRSRGGDTPKPLVTFVDPYFNPGEDPVQLQAYRNCLLRTSPGDG